MTLAEVHELHDSGWSICSHTWMHNGYYDPTVVDTYAFARRKYSQAYADLRTTQDWLIDNGFGDGATSHVYPNHYYNYETMEASKDLMLVDYSKKTSMTSVDTMPWGDSLRHISADTFARKENGVYPLIDYLEETGGLCIVMFHRFDGDNIGGSIAAETLDDMLVYLGQKKDKIDVITATDLAYATPVALR